MFLTKKALLKIWGIIGLYSFVFLFCLGVSIAFAVLHIDNTLHIIFCFISAFMAICSYFVGRYSEGKGKLINDGKKLIYHELRLAEFIRLYEEKRNCPENVISKPDVDVLSLLASAYSAFGDEEHMIETVETMLSIAPEKKKNTAKVYKLSVLYSVGRVEEAELLYSELHSGKMDIITKANVDMIIKTDRAKALGDYKIAEEYFKQQLVQTVPKKTPFSILCYHFGLAEIYYKTGRFDEAKIHYNYCKDNGGYTQIKKDAVEKLENL